MSHNMMDYVCVCVCYAWMPHDKTQEYTAQDNMSG